MLFPVAGALLMMMSSAGLAQDRPVNAAGLPTISLAEAGLSVMPDHPASTTETSPSAARVVRYGGQTVATRRGSQHGQARVAEAGAASGACGNEAGC